MCNKLSCWVLRPEVVLLLTNNVQYSLVCGFTSVMKLIIGSITASSPLFEDNHRKSHLILTWCASSPWCSDGVGGGPCPPCLCWASFSRGEKYKNKTASYLITGKTMVLTTQRSSANYHYKGKLVGANVTFCPLIITISNLTI